MKCALIGSGKIGLDLMMKIYKSSQQIELALVIGQNENSEGLRLAKEMGYLVTHEGLTGAVKMDVWKEIGIVFDATSAEAHKCHNEVLQCEDKYIIDLTPAAIGPLCVPVINMKQNLKEKNLNMVTCVGQAATPTIYAIARVCEEVSYVEASVMAAKPSVGQASFDNMEQAIITTQKAFETIGGAQKAKVNVSISYEEPPILMRNVITVFIKGGVEADIRHSVGKMVEEVKSYVPGYRLKEDLCFELIKDENADTKVSYVIEVEGAGDYLPKYSGNLDIITAASLATAECIVENI